MTEGLPPALGRALALLGPGARRWLPRLLEPLMEAPGDDRWRRSLLTPERFPVELSVSTASPRTDRYATEFVSPARPPGTRLAAGLERLARIGLPPPHAQLTALLLDAHRRHPVVWGTWLAGRHDTRGDRFKLYAEVPKAAAVPVERAVARLIGARPFPLPEARLRLVGIDLTTGAVECYHRVGRLTVADLRLLTPRDLDPGQECLADAVRDLLGRPAVDELPGFNVNVSTAPRALSVSAPARSWLGTDPEARTRLLDHAQRHGFDLRRYAALTAGSPLTHRNRHGMLTVTAQSGPAAHLTIGFSP
ncbi:hypothetical protein GCM10010260_50900 [Streptomyces filipinensis]|uniref:Uncharacterized protein n=1 Tax=Streptomyces filipinensis TaxID=66887 RepID=A0A918IFB4_9ACTN|nr:hypothetical protein [Streptomyces filipinensis]GGV07074.1 hypothetical protein GCM10010260_50900 [Streptomyces filipinensis]